MLSWMFTDEPWSPSRRFLYLGTAWGVLAALHELAASLHLVFPGIFGDVSWLSYGRLRAAAVDLWIFGFCTNLLLGVLLAIVPSMVREPLWGVRLANLAFWLWNLAELLAGWALLRGISRGRLWGEAPPAADLLRLAAALLILWSLVRTARAGKRWDPMAWLGVGALSWLVLVLVLGKGLFTPGGNPYWGVADALAQAFLRQGLGWMWLFGASSAVALALAGGRLNAWEGNSLLALVVLLTTAAFAPFSTGSELIWGPVPFWVQTLGAVAAFLLLIPAASTAAGVWRALEGRWARLAESPGLAFFPVGSAAFLTAALAAGLGALLGPARIAGLTLWSEARTALLLGAGAGSVALGAAYTVIPAAVGRMLVSPRLAWWHFWMWTVGWFLAVVTLSMAGLVQGAVWATGTVPFSHGVNAVVPYLAARSIALGLVACGQVVFCWNVFLTVDSGAEVPAAERDLVLAV
ncbi:MAG: cbb3-type cytochrome c oxidase subunit I [Armatimonadota bacterium]|nr:cbb3-type cytochrome c oxidase subunit I [Armatimonadota bacterium]MDR7439154.1 cbb3-type cytochrome c oxidase subunit I [Armatimonadota bacterium]MDR7563019.1 cbb3-type cytochrome c oxidase subunit I [Armatimonadota bacterium]MDR7567670.1 cbb3-type cytochrome c oxidase subunit I [Armatimonadota bacterium]MDR7600863.1 cbb3-type cytochrome c oxidase subunit I [Armatimonadota bacterium]